MRRRERWPLNQSVARRVSIIGNSQDDVTAAQNAVSTAQSHAP